MLVVCRGRSRSSSVIGPESMVLHRVSKSGVSMTSHGSGPGRVVACGVAVNPSAARESESMWVMRSFG